MKHVIGIDGGGTKTAFALADENGEILHQLTKSGCSYLEIGKENVAQMLCDGINELLSMSDQCCEACCIGLPCYGENPKMDQWIQNALEKELYPMKVQLVNDAVVGWAGSLNGQEGIHIVAGTGSLAIGKGTGNEFVRSGGWNEFFSDEGSCYWVGKEAMTLFSKQSDGRLEKGALYNLVKQQYQLENDFDFIDVVLKEISLSRDQVAAFQKIALKAAQMDDKTVIDLYDRAAKELALMVKGVKKQCSFSQEPVSVSIYGGLLHASEYVLKPLETYLNEFNCSLHPAKHSAMEGAVILALQMIKTSQN